MEPPVLPPDMIESGENYVSTRGQLLRDADVISFIFTTAEVAKEAIDMLYGMISASRRLGLQGELASTLQATGTIAQLVEAFKDNYPMTSSRAAVELWSRAISSAYGPQTPTVTVAPSKGRNSSVKTEKDKTGMKDADVGITELAVEEVPKEDLVSDYELNAPPETAELFASQDVDDQDELNAQRAKEASLRARQFNGRYVNTPRGKTGATLAHSPAWRTAYDAPRERARKLGQLAAEESSARVTSATNNLRANIEARQLQQLQESRHAQAQAIASKARSAEHDRREAERRRERRELISSAYEVMYGEPLGDAINELGVEEEMRMAKQFYKIMGGKGSPGFLRKAYSPRAARVTTVAMERKVSPPKRTTRKKKSVKFVLEEVDVPQKKISKRTYMKKSSGKSGKRGSGGKKGKGKKGKGKGKGGKK